MRDLKKMTDGLGADVVIDAVGAEADGHVIQHVTSAKLKLQGGSPVALNWAIDSVRKGGTVSVMGAYGPLFSAVKFGDAMNKGLTIRTNQAPVKRQWPRLFEHIRAGHLTPSDLITHRIPLDHIAEGYHIFSSKLDDSSSPSSFPRGLTDSGGDTMPYTADKPGATPRPRRAARAHPRLGCRPRPRRPPRRPARAARHPDRRALGPARAAARRGRREQSVEHERLTPVYGTAQPLHGLAGRIRRFAYDRYSEGQTAHWLLLVVGDRVDAITAHVTFADQPSAQTTRSPESGVLGDAAGHPVSSRFGRGRIDLKHAWLDPLIILGPWLAAAWLGIMVVRAGVRFARR